MLLGLDISTSCTGWCVFNNEKFIQMGFIELSKIGSMIEKSNHVRDKLLEMTLRYNIENICIEQNLQAFRPGLSSAKTLLTLARFNGIVSYLCHDIFDVIPEYVNVNSARKACNIKLDRKSKLSTKEQILNHVSLDMDANGLIYTWPKKTLKRGPRAGMEIYRTECYDMADAYVVCKAHIVLNNCN